MLRRDLDEIAEHVVVTDLERLDAGVVGIAPVVSLVRLRAMLPEQPYVLL